MDFDQSTLWWVVAGVLVAAELASGTFYLLMLALGAAAAALAAHLGMTATQQMVVAALVGGSAVVFWHFKRRHATAGQPPVQANPDVNLDIGSVVHVEQWDAEGMGRVKYRGAEWQVRFQGSGTPGTGRHVIRGVDGNCLLLDR